MSTVHLLKCHTPFFNEIELNNKRFEIRLNDRDYQEGDILDLRDFAPVAQKFTGRGVQRRVAYILHEGPFGLKPGYCSMSIQPLDYDAAREAACVKFCAGIHIEALTLLNQADHPTLSQICEENQSLRKQLTDIKTRTAINAIELAKEKQRILFDQDAADKLSRCGAEVEVLKLELAKNQAVKEWMIEREKWPTVTTEAVFEEEDHALKIGFAWKDDSSLEKWFPFAADELTQLRAELSTLRKELEAAKNLKEYVRHKQGCGYYIDDEPCTCGLDELRKQGEEK